MSHRRIIRMSERYVSPMNEFKVKDMLSRVEAKVRSTRGLERIETLSDQSDPNRHVVVTEWRSRAHLDAWLSSDLCRSVVHDLSKVLDRPPRYREFLRHEDDELFLL